MKRLLAALALLFVCASGVSALKLGKTAPKITVYRPSPTQIVAYDARPEFALAVQDLSKKSLDWAASLGVRIVKHTLDWSKLEATEKPGLYDSAYLATWDALVERCRAEGTCLVVAIDGVPPGVSFSDRAAAYERLARFAADMSARYPSVVYWEPLGQSGAESTLIGAKDGASALDRGRYCAEMLKVVYPAIKSANPAAWVLCPCPAGGDDFAISVLAAGKGYFDMIDLATVGALDPKTAIDSGKRAAALAGEAGAEGIPVWLSITSTDVTPAQLEGLFAANNEEVTFQKVLLTLDPASLPEVQRWLSDTDPNQALFDRARATTNLLASSKVPMAPVGYDFRPVEGGVEVQRVFVDSLVPTRVQLMFIAEPRPPKPGEKPVASPRKSTRPIPDPFDI